MLLLALLSMLFALNKKYRWLWYSGAASLGFLLMTFVNLQAKLSALRSITTQQPSLSWGWIVLLSGAGLTLAAATIRENAALAATTKADSAVGATIKENTAA